VTETPFLELVAAKYSDYIESSKALNDVKGIILVNRVNFLDLARIIKEEYGFTHPVSGGALDYLKENFMQMNYYIMNPTTRFQLIYGVKLPRDDLNLPSLTNVWEAFSFHEREAHEMFGIMFEGHPNLIPLLLPPDWKGGYPLRKDFKGEGVEE
jgi:NADH-quinone oxidoreductase subunit C